MGIQVQFLSRFCIVWNVPCFGPKYTLRSPKERKSLEVGVGDFYKHRGLQTILQHGSGASAWPAWCTCGGLTFSVLQTLELKAEFLLQFKNYQGKKFTRNWCLIVEIFFTTWLVWILSPLKIWCKLHVLLVSIVLQGLCFWQPRCMDVGHGCGSELLFPPRKRPRIWLYKIDRVRDTSGIKIGGVSVTTVCDGWQCTC